MLPTSPLCIATCLVGLGALIAACDETSEGNAARVSAVTADPVASTSSTRPASSIRKAPPPVFEGTAGVVERGPRAGRMARLGSVRAGRHDGFDRVVFEFSGGDLPGYHIEYIDKPVRKCGTNEPTPILGDGWLEVRLAPATVPRDGGRADVLEEQMSKLPTLLELELTCDADATVTWVLGVGSPNHFRVLELREPTRLVVDVRHD